MTFYLPQNGFVKYFDIFLTYLLTFYEHSDILTEVKKLLYIKEIKNYGIFNR